MAGKHSARAQARRVHESHHPQAQNLSSARSSTFKTAKSSYKVTKKMEYTLIVVISGLSLILYWNTLAADFAYDDSRAIKTNQDLLPTTPVTNLFFNDFWGTPLTHSGSHKSYRPLCVLSFRLNYALTGFEPWSYHMFNVLLHAAVTGLFVHLATILFLGSLVPILISGLLFAAHPIHTEAVAGVVGRADVGACLFFLLSLISYIKYCRYRDRKLNLYASLMWATASMLTKEHGITVLVVCAMYDIFVHHRLMPREVLSVLLDKRHKTLREGILHLIGAAITLLAFRFHLMGSKPPDFAPADNPASDSSSFLTRTLTFLYLPSFNFWLLLCPKWLSFDWSMESIPLLTSPLDVRNLYSACFYGGTIHLIYYLSKTLARRSAESGGFYNQFNAYSNGMAANNNNNRVSYNSSSTSNGRYNKSKGFAYAMNNNHYPISNGHRVNGHAMMSNGYTTPSSFVGPAGQMGSRNCSLPPSRHDVMLIAISLLVFPFIPATNLFFYVGFVVAERVLYIPSMGFCILIALGAEQLYKRTEYSFIRKLLVSCTIFLLVILSMRTVMRNMDWWHEENLYRSGIPINPPKAYGNLANILSSQGKKMEAEWAYKKALSYRANMADVHYNLGILLQEQLRYDEALLSYRLAIQFRPRLAMAHLNLGLVLAILGRKEEAAEVYRHCAQLDSSGLKDPKMHETTKISALFNLGRLYADEGSYADAIKIYQEAVQKMPEHYQPQSLYNMMGEAFFKLEKFHQAEFWYGEALKVKPDHIPAHLTYAKLLSKLNRLNEAEKWFLKAKALAPNDSSVYQHYGQFLSECERHNEAADVYVRAADISPDEYEIVFNAANTLRQANRNAEAETYYQMAVKLRPHEVTSHMNLGAMLHVNGKLLEAESSYLEALKLRPDDAITQNNLQKLRNLLVQKGLKNARTQNRR